MAKFLKRDQATGTIQEESTVTVSAGAADVGKAASLDAAGKLDPSVMPVGIGADTQSAVASEALAANDLINFHNVAGVLNMRKADKTNGRAAMGFVKAAVANAASGVAFLEGALPALARAPGARQYLDTAGGVTEAPATAAGHLHQYIGNALTATSINFEADDPILLA